MLSCYNSNVRELSCANLLTAHKVRMWDEHANKLGIPGCPTQAQRGGVSQLSIPGTYGLVTYYREEGLQNGRGVM